MSSEGGKDVSLQDAILQLTAEVYRVHGRLDGLVTHERAQDQGAKLASQLREELKAVEERSNKHLTDAVADMKCTQDDLREDLIREIALGAKRAADEALTEALERDTNSMKRMRLIIFIAGGMGLTSLISSLADRFLGG